MTEREQLYLYQSVGERLREFRKKMGFSQEDLAKKVDLSRVSIVNIEKGRQHPTLHLLIDLSRIFNVTVSDFLPNITPDTKNNQRILKNKVTTAVRNTSDSSGEEIDSNRILEFIQKLKSDNK